MIPDAQMCIEVTFLESLTK